MTSQTSMNVLDSSRTGSTSVRVDGLTMRYDTTDVLKDVGFEIPSGQKVAVLGPNGAGKSTLIEILEGLRKPSGGNVSVLGHRPDDAPEQWRSRLGVVLQAWRDHGTWKIGDFLRYISAAHRAAGVANLWPVDELLEAVELGDRTNQQIRSLSGGQRRRVDVAAALISRPELLFLDEPTTGFDPEIRQSFYDLVRSLAHSTTIIWATHNLYEAEEMCERIIILNHGRVVADGSPTELRATLASTSTVSWMTEQGPRRRVVADSDLLVRELVTGPERAWNLEVQRGTLEQVYLSIVRENNTAEEVRP
ncbi:ABC transporter ATP-binding protein [Williamsia sp. R60]